MPDDLTALDGLTSDLFDLDSRRLDGDLLVVDSLTDNGCGTQPSCQYPGEQD
jgi:hypothetical protein